MGISKNSLISTDFKKKLVPILLPRGLLCVLSYQKLGIWHHPLFKARFQSVKFSEQVEFTQ